MDKLKIANFQLRRKHPQSMLDKLKIDEFKIANTIVAPCLNVKNNKYVGFVAIVYFKFKSSTLI